MQVRQIMTEDPACCGPGQTVQEAARVMARDDCGCVPVVDQDDTVVGVVTDRDIACRCVAEGKAPETQIREVMSSPARCCTPSDDVAEAERIMSEAQVRRVPVVDEQGRIVGMVAQADLARSRTQLGDEQVAEVLATVSAPTGAASQTSETKAGRSLGR
jgi:CBS domain-containing protein